MVEILSTGLSTKASGNNSIFMKNSQYPKVALVHDFLTQYGGAERVLEVMCEMYPEAPIYTLLYDKEKLHGKFSAKGGSASGGKGKEIHTSFLQKFPKFLRKRYKWLLPFFPVAPETFDLRDFDLVLSSSGAWTKGIITRLNTIHICYLHSPMRFVWDNNEEYLTQQRKCFLTNFFIRRILNYIRIWDKVAADRPDYIISNSKYTAARVKKYYGRESEVIYPPVFAKASTGKPVFAKDSSEINSNNQNSNIKVGDAKYFLIISRLSPYKKIDKVIEAFNRLKLPLVIVGEGAQRCYLEKIAKGNIKFLGWQPDSKMSEIYQNARAFLFAGVDDFGLAPAEALGRGVPVIAVNQGGAKEIVIEGKTGEFFNTDAPEDIIKAVKRFEENEGKYDREVIIARAGEFSKERFISSMEIFIKNKMLKSKEQMSNHRLADRQENQSPND